MLKNPSANLNVLCNCCAMIGFKQLYLSNHSELVTCIYELSFPTMTNTITSHNIDHSHWITLYIRPLHRKKYSTKNSFDSSVFLIHVFFVISYHSSHRVMCIFLMNITYLTNYFNHPNFSILSASNNSIKGNVKFFLYKPFILSFIYYAFIKSIQVLAPIGYRTCHRIIQKHNTNININIIAISMHLSLWQSCKYSMRVQIWDINCSKITKNIWRRTQQEEVQLHSFLKLAIEAGE